MAETYTGKYKVRMGIVVELEVDTADPNLVLHMANARVREGIEQNLPPDILMKVFVTEVDGRKVKNDYV